MGWPVLQLEGAKLPAVLEVASHGKISETRPLPWSSGHVMLGAPDD
jgi:hypothetical protein